MTTATGAGRRRAFHPVVGLLAVLLVGLNLRGPIAAVAPVLDEITADLALTPTTAGLLPALPVLCFAVAAPLASRAGRLLGPVPAIGWGLVLLSVGLVVRVLAGPSVLLVGTVLVGLGMTVANVLLPVVIKRDFPGRVAAVTGMYTATLAGGAALTAALTAPVSTQWGWRWSLAGWVVLPLLAIGLWWVAMVRSGVADGTGRRTRPAPGLPVGHRTGGGGAGRSVWRQPTAWAVALVLGFQSVLYYSLTSWMPLLLQDEAGLGRAAAGNAMSLFQLLGIPATLVVPALCRRRPDQSWLGLLLGAGWFITVGGLLLLPGWWLLWSVVGGLTQGAGISLAFTLVVLRAHDPDTVREVSAMGQFVGYGLGAAGPVAVGALTSATDGWTAPLVLLAAVAVALAVSASVAGRDREIVART